MANELDRDSWEVACCREISHLTTDDGEPLDLLDLRVVPLVEPPHNHHREAHGVIDAIIPGAARAYRGDRPGAFAPPHSIVIARAFDREPFKIATVLSSRIERLVLVARLLYASTCESEYEVQGETSLVRRFDPVLVRFVGGDGPLLSNQLIRRTARLSARGNGCMTGLAALIDEANRNRPGMIVTSFGMAVHKFQRSYHSDRWYEQLVDLATAFEASLSGKANADVVLRLKTRAAALLTTDRDPAGAIFKDVGLLYGLRSKLVHGGDLKQRDLEKEIYALSTVPEETMFGVALAHTVDRLRDLVRRSLLARVCLASGDEPLWPLGKDDGVDSILADDVSRQQWRASWRETLDSFGALAAADRPPIAADSLSMEDR